LDNSTDLSTTEEYLKLCEEHGFEHIKKENLGICGGRQWIAEHFETTDLDYYLFFEDDMFFFPNEGSVCRNGFNRYVPNLYTKSLEIIKKENFDFLKLNYSEFYGDNGTQWSWYNVPQSVREEFWPEKSTLPHLGLDPNAPKTKFSSILSHKGLPYGSGEVYYCNWPQIVSRPGNKKMFLDTTWAHPFEQTWMSHMYQLTKKGELSSGLLLLSPTEHDRFEHYEGELRKES
jgi:ligand-binding SRPBCC domain-containing protein